MSDISDDYDFTPSASSNLRSLFGSSDTFDHAPLTYTAPKQPKVENTSAPKTEQPKVETSALCAQIVEVWKLVDGKYVAIGKLGCALISSSNPIALELILYKEKRNVLMRVKVGPHFEIHVKKDDFVSFYDSGKDNWLIKFNTYEDISTVLKHVEDYDGKVIKTENTTEKTNQQVETADNKTRADILTRIAKMGQSILPTKETDPEEEIEVVQTKSNTDSSLVLKDTNLQTSMPVANVANRFVVPQPINYDPFNVFIAENRINNTEVKMNLSDIIRKIDSIVMAMGTDRNTEKDTTNRNTEEKLKSKVKVLELKLENLSGEMAAIEEENMKLKYMKEQDISKHTKQEEKDKELDLCKNSIEELTNRIKKQDIEISEIRQQLVSDNTKWESEVSKLEDTISQLQQKLNVAENPNKKIVEMTTLLKQEMNDLYTNIMSDSADIAQSIKVTTRRIMAHFQQMYQEEPQL